MGHAQNALDQLDAAQLALETHQRLQDGRCGGLRRLRLPDIRRGAVGVRPVRTTAQASCC